MPWDRVLTINAYWDGPREGVAEVDGVPHVYQSLFDDEADDYSETCLVSPISQEMLELALEAWAIWLRWRSAFDRGEVSLDTHPVLAVDRARHEELKRLVGSGLDLDSAGQRRLRAKFRRVAGEGTNGRFEVEWSEAGE
jgi:hypothetical protein